MITNTHHSGITPWVSCPRPNSGASLRLFCFPYSGAAASIYYPWAEILPLAIEVFPVQLPGRGTRVTESLCTCLSELIPEAAKALLPLTDKPFAFFGHSLGALMSFELARHLQIQYGLKPVHLFVSGHNSPHLPDDTPPIHALPEMEFVDKLKELNGMSDEIIKDRELMQMLIPILRADFAVCETYQYTNNVTLECPISAYGGLRDIYISREGLEAWKEQTRGPLLVRMFPGDHFYLNTDRMLLLQSIARELTPYLNYGSPRWWE